MGYSVDDAELTPLAGVEATLRGAQIAKTTFAVAARHAADVFHGDDVRTSTLRRTIIPLVLSTLKEAYADARAARTQPEPPRRTTRPAPLSRRSVAVAEVADRAAQRRAPLSRSFAAWVSSFACVSGFRSSAAIAFVAAPMTARPATAAARAMNPPSISEASARRA